MLTGERDAAVAQREALAGRLAASKLAREALEAGIESPVLTTVATTPDDFIRRGKAGAIVADSIPNVRSALKKLAIELTYDDFRRESLVNGRPADDLTIDRLWVQIDDAFKFRPSKELLRTVVVTEGLTAIVHPAREYFARVEPTWDGRPRLDGWLATYAGAAPSPYVDAVGTLPLIAAVRRVRHPGTKFDELLVLESGQGMLKSTAISTLAPDPSFVSDDLPLGVDSKQVIERTAGKLLIEAAEMYGYRGRQAEALKAFLSRQVDGPVRLAYGRLPVSVPRQFVIIGTTNTMNAYLKDSTGGRRFWPVRVERFDIDALRRDRDQLWAEAATREAAGESIRLAPALWPEAGEHQERRRAADPWEELLEPLFDDDTEAVAVDTVWRTLGVEASHRDNRHADRVAEIMQRHGFTYKRKVRRDGAAPAWHWLRVPTGSEQRAE